jgi:syntaxin 16
LLITYFYIPFCIKNLILRFLYVIILEINSREERNRLFFHDEPFDLMNKSSDYWSNESTNNEPSTSLWPNEQSQDSVLLQIDDVEQNIKIAAEREQEVEHIVQSISELHDVFKVAIIKISFKQINVH